MSRTPYLQYLFTMCEHGVSGYLGYYIPVVGLAIANTLTMYLLIPWLSLVLQSADCSSYSSHGINRGHIVWQWTHRILSQYPTQQIHWHTNLVKIYYVVLVPLFYMISSLWSIGGDHFIIKVEILILWQKQEQVCCWSFRWDHFHNILH